MAFKVIFKKAALAQFQECISYIEAKIGNFYAAKAVAKDADETVKRLSVIANGLKFCNDDNLCKLGYRTIHFKKHHYIMLYRIDGNTVYIVGVFHAMQDYENIFDPLAEI